MLTPRSETAVCAIVTVECDETLTAVSRRLHWRRSTLEVQWSAAARSSQNTHHSLQTGRRWTRFERKAIWSVRVCCERTTHR